MTTVAYRDGILVADSGISGAGTYHGSTKKIFRGKRNGVAGGAGHCSIFSWLEEWAEKHDFAVDFLKSHWDCEIDGVILWIKPDQTIWLVEDGHCWRLEAPFAAIGSGEQIALGAMAAGASAEQAVHIACGFDNGSHMPLQVMPVFTDNIVAFNTQ